MQTCRRATTSDEEKIDNGSCENLVNDSQMQLKGGAHKDDDHEDMDAKLQEGWDEVSGVPSLDPKDVRRSRLEEIQYIKDKVWERIPRQETVRRGCKIVKVRWTDMNKDDSTNWRYSVCMLQKIATREMKMGFFCINTTT